MAAVVPRGRRGSWKPPPRGWVAALVLAGGALVAGGAGGCGEPSPELQVAARASALRHRFDDEALADSARVAAGTRLLTMDPEYLELRYPERPRLVRTVVEAAVARRDTSALPLLVRLLDTRAVADGLDVAAQLRAYGGAARGPLVALLGDHDHELVQRALEGLAIVQATTASDTVATLLAHDDERLRAAAARALGDLGDRGWLTALDSLARHDSTATVRTAAEAAAQALRTSP